LDKRAFDVGNHGGIFFKFFQFVFLRFKLFLQFFGGSFSLN